MLTGPKLSPLERASCIVSGDTITRHVPGCSITTRLLINEPWLRAMYRALELACHFHYSDREIERQINQHLDTLDDPLSGLERRIIIGHALGKAES